MASTLTSAYSRVFYSKEKLFKSTPVFKNEQVVCFLGGKGKIKDCKPLLGTWIYSVEMELGPEPECGRLGAETTILLTESEIYH